MAKKNTSKKATTKNRKRTAAKRTTKPKDKSYRSMARRLIVETKLTNDEIKERCDKTFGERPGSPIGWYRTELRREMRAEGYAERTIKTKTNHKNAK